MSRPTIHVAGPKEASDRSVIVVSTEVIDKAGEAVMELVRIVEEKRPRSEGIAPAARLAACAIAVLLVWTK